jgi:hypothetical protein
MKMFQNTSVAFRCPAGLKAKMAAYAEANEQHLSDFIRSACVDALRHEFPPSVPTKEQIEQKLAEIVR